MADKLLPKRLAEPVKKIITSETGVQSVKYLISSCIAFAVDYVILLALERLFSGFALAMELAAVISFCVSSQINFHINRLWVFKKREGLLAELGGYYALALVSFSLKTFVLLELFVRVAGLPTIIAKPIAEVVMFVFNFFVQKKVIFRKKKDIDSTKSNISE